MLRIQACTRTHAYAHIDAQPSIHTHIHTRMYTITHRYEHIYYKYVRTDRRTYIYAHTYTGCNTVSQGL